MASPPKPLGLSVPSFPSCPIWHLFCSLAPQIKHSSHTGPPGPHFAACFKAVNSGPFLTAGPNVSVCAGCWKPLLWTCTRQKCRSWAGLTGTQSFGDSYLSPPPPTPHASVRRQEYRVIGCYLPPLTPAPGSAGRPPGLGPQPCPLHGALLMGFLIVRFPKSTGL